MTEDKNYPTPLILLSMLILWLFPVLGLAQAPGFEGDTNDIAAPLDGGVSLLVAAGVGYRIHRQFRAKKKPAPDEEQAL